MFERGLGPVQPPGPGLAAATACGCCHLWSDGAATGAEKVLQRRQPLARFLFGQVSKIHRTTLLFAYSSKAGEIERHKQNCWPPPGNSVLPGLKAPRTQPWEAFPHFSRQLISHPLTDLEKGYKVSAEGNSSGKRKSAVCSIHQHARLSCQHTHLTAEAPLRKCP